MDDGHPGQGSGQRGGERGALVDDQVGTPAGDERDQPAGHGRRAALAEHAAGGK